MAQWSVYDGCFAHVPRATGLRAVCTCGWAGTEHPLDWDQIGDQELDEDGARKLLARFGRWSPHR